MSRKVFTDQASKEILAIYKSLETPSLRSLEKAGVTRGMIRQSFGTLTELRDVAGDAPADPKAATLDAYLSLVDANGGQSPTLAEISRIAGRVYKYFDTRENIDKVARKQAPARFTDVVVTDIKIVNPKKKTIIITSSVLGAPVHMGACTAFRRMADREKADILSPVCVDSASRASPGGVGRVDKAIIDLGFNVVQGRDVRLNDNLSVLGIEVSAKQLVPITGLDRYGQRGQSIVIAAPKQFLKYVPTMSSLPHAIMTTGACTAPFYDTDRQHSKRTAYQATQDHQLAGVIVEIEDDKIFHFRQLRYSEDLDNIVDLGFTDSGTEYKPQAIQLGDWHSGATAFPNYKFAMANPFGADQVFLHDAFDGHSINPHEEQNDPLNYMNSSELLQVELDGLCKDISLFLENYKEVFIVESNHDQWLDAWVRSGRYRKDRTNFHVGRRLEDLLFRYPGQSALNAYLSHEFLRFSDRLKLIGPNDDYRIGGVAMNHHGHVGPNGIRKPSPKVFESSVGETALGHLHTPMIWRDVTVAGTSTEFRQGYNKGPSSWMWTHTLVYPCGRRQLYNLIPGSNQEWVKDE